MQLELGKLWLIWLIGYLDYLSRAALVGSKRIGFVGFVVTFLTLGGRGPVCTSGGALRGDEIANTRHTQVEGETNDERWEKTADTRREGSLRDLRRPESRDAGSRKREIGVDRTGAQGCGFDGELGMVYITGLNAKQQA